ncbi:putative WRKY transcription factor 41 [Bidens hawaiensis]|uniref:putative WRKY transcription factor 41 n=1 Tax=Bidens hawaiensis TaxID=980011 RepID=UPI00404A402D
MDTSFYIINELTQGMELAMHLKSILSSETSSETKQILIQEIISSYDRAMLMVNLGDTAGQTPPLALAPAPPTLSHPESSVSIDESPRIQDIIQPFDNQHDDKVLSKKRKAMPTWQDQIRISTDNGLEGSTDDGYSWRKYGQKTILGAKYPRSYYRCTYRHAHNCMARKQVQRTDEDPTVFDIIYKGQHTCNPAAKPSAQQPKSPEKHEIKVKQINHQREPGEMLSNLKENLRVCTSDLDTTVPCSFSFPSASFNYLQGSPSGSNYFTEWVDFHPHDDSNLSRMISTTASATNSPLAFPADLQDLSPFNNSGFLI